ncbi:MAG: TIM barrel protein, partial [Phycisphaeraceae bacterium]
ERVALFKAISSEYIGACVDTGNSMALLEDPVITATALAPYAFSVHLKDQAVKQYDEGFLLGDIPLGHGCIDLKRVVAILKKAKPKVNFALELITRDALKVPVLTKRYWATLNDAAKDDVLWIDRLLATRAAKELQQVSSLSEEERVKLEDENVNASLRYAHTELALV